MTTRARTLILLLCIALVAFTLCACLDLDDGERIEWQREVLGRQRGLQRPTPTVVAERTGK